MKTIGRGAEATIYRDKDIVIKERQRKDYRILEIDSTLRTSRTRREAKVLEKLNTLGLPIPKLIAADDKKMTITMEFLDGEKVRDVLTRENCKRLCTEIGTKIGLMHQQGIIHGDLTTSNMIQKEEVYFIDFGLSFFSDKVEDKAVDLHLLHQALESKHSELYEEAFAAVLEGYRKGNSEYDAILKRFRSVEERGRNKHKAG